LLFNVSIRTVIRGLWVSLEPVEHPDLCIIASRPAWLWQDEMISVMLHKPDVWNEVHGWSPKYLPAPRSVPSSFVAILNAVFRHDKPDDVSLGIPARSPPLRKVIPAKRNP
jgi:hypothetical protein